MLGGSRVDATLRLSAVVALQNDAVCDDCFAVGPAAFAAAVTELQRTGHDLLGFWHSHGNGDPRPSATDRRELWREHLHVIAGVDAVGAERLCAYWLDTDLGFHALPLTEQDDDR